MAATFDAALQIHRHHRLSKINVISSDMVYENTSVFPRPEAAAGFSAPRSRRTSSRSWLRYLARGAWEQYQFPYTIIRPFNYVGVGESRALKGSQVAHGNLSLAMSHVVPDLIKKVLKGHCPLHTLGYGRI